MCSFAWNFRQKDILKICQAAPLKCSMFFTILIVPLPRRSKWTFLTQFHHVLAIYERSCGTQLIWFFSSSRNTTSDCGAGVGQATKRTATRPHQSLSYCFREVADVKSALGERDRLIPPTLMKWKSAEGHLQKGKQRSAWAACSCFHSHPLKHTHASLGLQ